MNSQSHHADNASIGIIPARELDDFPADTDIPRRGKTPWVFRRIAPYLGAIGALLLVTMVLFTMYFTWLSWQWMAFLSGILGAAIVSLVSRSIHAEWLIARRTAQLSLAHQKLARENRLRVWAEKKLADIERDLAHLHESLPAMVAYVDERRQIMYHNRAYRLALGGGAGEINGRHLRDVVGAVAYGTLEEDLSAAFAGSVVHREDVQVSADGETYRLLLQYLPRFNSAGAVEGVFLLSTDITRPEDVSCIAGHDVAAAGMQSAELPPPVADIVVQIPDSPEKPDRPDNEAVRLRDALAGNEFCLFFQTIEPVAADAAALPFREVLLRLKAEEENMLPPGSFLPVAEQHGMLPALDRWVVRHLLGWVGADRLRQRALYSINLSMQTVADPGFPDFVAGALREFAQPGSLLCFELQEAAALSQPAEVLRFVRRLQPAGCKIALCGFSGDRASLDLLRRVPVNFLKIDGTLILHMRRSAIDQARVKAIHRVAKAIGIGTIAECVEDNKTLARLRAIGVDFAQGFAISLPQALEELAGGMPVSGAEAFVTSDPGWSVAG